MYIIKLWKVLPGLLAVCLSAGCLTDETTHTLYLEPEGEISWTILQEHVRSEAETRLKRGEEEASFLEEARRNEHAAAEFLIELGFVSIDTRIIRDARPFTVLTTGRQCSIDRLLRDLLDEAGPGVRVELELAALEARLTITCPFEQDQEEQEYSCQTLHELFEEATLWLTEGQFSDSVGFVIAAGSTRASLPPLADFDLQVHNGAVLYSLTWQLDDPAS